MKITAEGIAVIEGDNYLSAEIIAQGRLDTSAEVLESYRPYIPQGGVVYDVGASLGDYTLTFSKMVGGQGRVMAFEPNPPTYQCLMWNMRHLSNVGTYDFGLGTGANATVIPDHNNIGASRLEPADSGSIRTATLDSIGTAGHGRLDFIKIDAEGWEPLILENGAQTIKAYRPVMLIEVNTWPLGKMNFTPEDVFKRLDWLGYVFPRFDGPYGDILCIPKERA